MKLLHRLRTHLGWKLFLTYVIIIVVGVLVLGSAAALAIPAAFEQHLAAMATMMGGMVAPDEHPELFASYRAAVSHSLFLSASAATLAAMVVSLLVSRSVVEPVRRMTAASRRIADGRYGERVIVRGGPSPDEMDELDQLAVAFNQMADRLERAETMRRQLIGDVAHELRTPLSTIKGSLEGLIDGVLRPDEANLLRLHGEAEGLQRLVGDLQDLSRVEAGAFALKPQPASVHELVAIAVDRLSRQFEDKGVKLKLELPPELPAVRADELRIGQVLVNLLGNALQYSPGGTEVQVHARQSGAEVQIEIQDQGIGIPSEHLPHIFTRFYRVDRSRSRAGGGSGIGLTIARHLVEAHGGRIWATSPGAGRGSHFTFTLPVAS